MERKKLSEQENLFCNLCAGGENPREAAARAGYRNAVKSAVALMQKREINEQVKKEKKAHIEMRAAADGLKKIAFGSISDAVRLLLCESADEIGETSALDLFMVSEIKKVKGGGIEIKFFDRIRALEKLLELEGSNDLDRAAPFYKALSLGAKGLCDADER